MTSAVSDVYILFPIRFYPGRLHVVKHRIDRDSFVAYKALRAASIAYVHGHTLFTPHVLRF